MANAEKVEAMTDFLSLGSKITANGDHSHEIRSCLLLGRKAMTNLDSVLKSKGITLLTEVCTVKAMIFPVSFTNVRVGSLRRLNAKELILLNCGAGEDSWESLGLQGDKTSQFLRKSVLNIHWKNWFGSWSSNIFWQPDAKDSLERPWCWGRLKAGGEGVDRGWVGWMASLTQWTWV